MIDEPRLPDAAASLAVEPHNLEMVYDELRAIARAVLRGEYDERSLGATGLVHEVVVRLLLSHGVGPDSDARFVLAAARRCMTQVLIDRARARGTVRRGGGWRRLALDDVLDELGVQECGSCDLAEALARLESHDERLARIIYLRYFDGFSIREVARDLNISVSTVEAGLRLARARLKRELNGVHLVVESLSVEPRCAHVVPGTLAGGLRDG